MLTLRIINPLSSEKVKKAMKMAKSPSDFKRWQVIYFVLEYNVDADYLADITGYSKANIYAIVQRHNNMEKPDVSTKIRGGRKRSHLSKEEEEELMKGLEQQALAGQILSFRDIKGIVEAKVGKEVSDDFIWDLFKRNNWTKHTPRPYHPKKDVDSQEAFKKNYKTIWLPLKMISNQS